MGDNDLIYFRDEASIETWVFQNWRYLNLWDFFPEVPGGCVYDDEAEETRIDRQVMIAGANEDGTRHAPADLIISRAVTPVSAPDVVTNIVKMVIELKARAIEPKDLAQIGRYMTALRDDLQKNEETDRLGCQYRVHGMLLGTGVSWSAFHAARLSPWVEVCAIQLEATYLVVANHGQHFNPATKAVFDEEAESGTDDGAEVVSLAMTKKGF